MKTTIFKNNKKINALKNEIKQLVELSETLKNDPEDKKWILDNLYLMDQQQLERVVSIYTNEREKLQEIDNKIGLMWK